MNVHSGDNAELADDYAKAGFAQRLGFGTRPALLVVDFVAAYLTPGNDLYAGVEDSVVAAAALLRSARAAAIPVIYTKVVFAAGGKDGGRFFEKARALEQFVGEGPLGEIVPELAPLASEVVIRKQGASAFHGTCLASLLNCQGIDTVLISGLSTSGCVRATAVDAVQLSYRPIVVREAVGDRSPGPHAASLFDLDAKYADVVDLDQVQAYLASL